jgi:hypothetical protein
VSADGSGKAEALFAKLAETFRTDPSVTPPSTGKGGKFGASGLKVDGKLFAMISKSELVVKLPRQRVEELVDTEAGRQFDPGHGRLMKEWVTIPLAQGRQWRTLAEEAREFVGRTRAGSRRG